MAALPESQHSTSAAIVRWYESKPNEHRPHMGASIIGHPCSRYVWMTWRWAKKAQFPGRVLRLFDTGKREEVRLLEELRGIGAQVWDTDPNTGDQWRVSACNGHFGGSLDGVAKGLPEAPKTPAVLEFKTHSAKSFADLLSKKVAASKPQHLAQMQIYMGLMELDRALYVAVNKDTDDVYVEWVHFDKDYFTKLIDHAAGLIQMTTPPPRISDDPAHWQCKGCTHWDVCHGGLAAEANCRTCCHASPVENGAWHCDRHSTAIDDETQREGCPEHLLIPALVPYGQPVDGGPNWVAYKHRETGEMFTNGSELIKDYGPVFSSTELQHCPGELLKGIAQAKDVFPGAKVQSGGLKPRPIEMEWNTPEDLDKITKPATKRDRANRAAIAASLKQLEKMA
jgi:hypothetical protein